MTQLPSAIVPGFNTTVERLFIATMELQPQWQTTPTSYGKHLSTKCYGVQTAGGVVKVMQTILNEVQAQPQAVALAYLHLSCNDPNHDRQWNTKTNTDEPISIWHTIEDEHGNLTAHRCPLAPPRKKT